MAQLRGDLEILPFADLVQHLVQNHRIGTMSLTLGMHKKVLHVGEEGLRLLSTTTRRTNSLGEIMLRTGKVSSEELETILNEQKRSGIRLGEIVKQRGLITQQDLNRALREQAEEELYDLFLWTRASFEFKEGPPPPELLTNPMASAVIDSNPASIMLEAARRADELELIKKLVPDGSMIPVKTKKEFDESTLGMNPDISRSVIRQINGKHTVEQVIRQSLYPRFDALRCIYILAKGDHIKILDQHGVTAVRKKMAETKRKEETKMRRKAQSGTRSIKTVKAGTLILLGDLVTYRAALAGLLRQAGYEVVEEAAGDAVQLLSGGRKINAIIMDVAMDNPSGYDFCSWLSDNFGAPIIVLSSDPSEEAVRNAVGAGASNYVVKPFTRDQILQSVKEVLEGVHSLKK